MNTWNTQKVFKSVKEIPYLTSIIWWRGNWCKKNNCEVDSWLNSNKLAVYYRNALKSVCMLLLCSEITNDMLKKEVSSQVYKYLGNYKSHSKVRLRLEPNYLNFAVPFTCVLNNTVKIIFMLTTETSKTPSETTATNIFKP